MRLDKIIFLCTGNTCRSPIAEYYCKSLLPSAEVCSRGTDIKEGDGIAENSAILLAEMGIASDLHRAKMLTAEDSGVILAMTERHMEAAKGVLPSADIEMLSGRDISDPYGEGLDIYRAARDEIVFAVDCFVLAEMEKLCFSAPWSKGEIESFLRSGGEATIKEYGYSLFRTIAGETELMRIGVLPKFRGQGLSKGILSEIIRRPMFLEVRVSNTPAIRLYEGMGFVRQGERRGYYGDGEDAALYLLS